jgi:transposase
VNIHGQLCYISGSKVLSKKGIPELQIIISFNDPQQANTLYKDRWQIETVFRALKSSGFNIEDTHLKDIERINKLFALVMIAFVWAYKVGIYLNSLKPIKIKKHGRKAYSYFKYGLNYLARLLNISYMGEFKKCCEFLSCT